LTSDSPLIVHSWAWAAEAAVAPRAATALSAVAIRVIRFLTPELPSPSVPTGGLFLTITKEPQTAYANPHVFAGRISSPGRGLAKPMVEDQARRSGSSLGPRGR
jgi:hypothetical protein